MKKRLTVILSCLLCLSTLIFGQTNDVRPLLSNQIFEQEMVGGGTHLYEIRLKKDEFFQVQIEQKGIDVSLSLLDPNNKELARIDSLNGDKGLEILSAVTEREGNFILRVGSSNEKALKGIYIIKRQPSKVATPEDRKIVLVEREEQNKRDRLGKLIGEVPIDIGKISSTTSPEIFQSLLDKVTNGLKLAQSLKSLEGEALFLFFTARMFEEKEEFQKSIDYYKNTLEVIKSDENKRTNLRFMEVGSLKKMGRIYENKLNNPEEAAKIFFRAISLYKGDEEDEDKGLVLMYFGDVLMGFRFYPQAEENYLKAIKIFQKLQLQFELGATFGKLGRVYFEQENKSAEALKNFLESDKLLETSPDESEYQDIRLYNLGYISLLYERINDRGNSKLYREKAKKLEDKTKEPFVIFTNKVLLGDSLNEKGEYEKSLVIYQEALDFAVKSFREESISAQTLSLKKMMRVYVTMNRMEEAVKTFHKATDLLKALDDHSDLALFYEDFADLCDDELGAKVYSQAINILMSDEKRPKQVNFEEIARIQNKWAKAQLAIKEFDGALVNFRTSLLVQMSLYQQTGLADMLADRMIAFDKLNKKRLAIFFGKQAIALKQETRRTIKSFPIATQKVFLKGNRDIFEKLIVLLVEENRLDEAIQVINLFQNQEFFDFDNNDRFSDKTVFYTEQEKTALIELQRLQTSLTISKENFLSNPDFDKLGDLIERLETDFTKISSENDKFPRVAEVDNIKKVLDTPQTSTKQNTVIVYTLIGEKGFHLLLVSKTGIKHFLTPIRADELNQKIKEFIQNIQVIDAETHKPKIDVIAQAKELYNIIFKPLENELSKDIIMTIMWNLDGNLRYIPINALHDGRDYLIRRNLNNVVFTRSDMNQITNSPKSIWKVSSFINTEERKKVINNQEYYSFPALIAGEYEMNSIIKKANSKNGLLEGDALLNSEFTKESMLTELKKKNPVVHISSHFKIQPGDLIRSFLVLGDGTAFSLYEMQEEAKSFPNGRLFAGVDLLALSACDTGISEPDSDGREVDSFAELAQRFGALSVMATLWSVNECSTAEFMKLFYKNKIDNKMNKVEAIRQAQLALLDGEVKLITGCSRKSEDTKKDEPTAPKSTKSYKAYKENPAKPFEHPYYWSPFILYGNWK